MKEKNIENQLVYYSQYTHDNFQKDIETEIKVFVAQFKNLCDRAGIEGWLGSFISKDHKGLLGYMRMSYAMQLKILNNYSFLVPCYFLNDDIYKFFKSSNFYDEVKKNNCIKTFYKNEHFEFLKAEAKDFKANYSFSIEDLMNKLKEQIEKNKKIEEEYYSFEDVKILTN